MEQKTTSRYEVSPGEVITVQIIATQVGDTATFTASPATVDQIAASPRTFRFTADGGVAAIFGAVTCDFTAAQDGASFQVKVSSPGSGPFDGPTIAKDDPDSEEPVAIEFEFPL
ncbi:MAG TPA: hypothetical protein VHQ64_13810 [Pyrinomonadaceae bacterium]|jgi:hypothetical protein|nr:hypothetical protein [Pyrinomonadaceae bacterium]